MRDDEHKALRSFGRRRGRALSRRQAALLETRLPRLRLDLTRPAPSDLRELFGTSDVQAVDTPDDVWLEIGFGAGEHLLWQAGQNLRVGFIGCEPFVDGVAKVVSAVQETGLKNLRLHADDARDVLAWLPDASIGRAFILFPDPWPKARHNKRRLIAPTLVAELARVLHAGAEFRFATDIGDYARTALMAIVSSSAFAWQATGPADWRQRTRDWPPTRYEEKALAAGRRCYYFRFRRR